MKKKGFTLIELLAVIIIIENARMKSYKESVELMVHTAKLQYQTQEIQGNAPEIPEGGIIYKYGENANDTIQINIDEVGLLNFKGDKPSGGTITLKTSKTVEVDHLVSKDKRYCAKTNDKGEVEVGKNDSSYDCSAGSGSEEASVDDEPCALATETKDGKEYYYIDSVEDMYAFSDSVNSGNNYSGKVVKLRVNLNFSNYTSDKKTKVCKDNDNENGFTPIGTYISNPFSGTFEGNAKTISNLTINRPNQNFLGVFGYVFQGTIYGLNLNNIKVSGNQTVGTLAGSIYYGNANEIVVKDSEVTSSSYQNGGLVGYASDTYMRYILMKNIKVTSSTSSEVGAIQGSGGTVIGGVIESANVRGTTTSLDSFGQKGNINYYQKIGLDTWINGDDDNSGYYFDYESDSSNNIVLKTTENSPIPTSVATTFTKEGDYYLINNTNDWKKFAAFKDSQEKFKLTSDLDFNSKHFYMIDSAFSGRFNGGAKTIKNINLNVVGSDSSNTYSYVGIFKEVRTRVREPQIFGLNLDNVKVSGGNNVGTLVGYFSPDWSTIEEISLNNCEVSSQYSYFGGLVGNIYDCQVKNILVKNVKITGNNTTSGAISGNGGVYNYIIETADVRGTTQTTLESSSNKDDLSYYSGKIETRLDEDSNNTGYSFGYDEEKGGIYVVPRDQRNKWELINNKEPLTSQKWVYWNNDGTRIQSGFHVLKDFSNNDQTYYFENGVAVLGLKEINGNTYYFSTSDTLPTNGYVDANMVHNQTIMIGATPYTFGSDGKCTNCN